MVGGADFIKTSTGKVSPAATLPVALVMLEAVRDFAELSGDARRRQGRRRHPQRQGRHQVPRRRERDRRGGLARPVAVPLRRLEPAERPADAALQAAHRRLRRARRTSACRDADDLGVRTGPESRAIVDLRPSYGLFIDGEFVEPIDGSTFKTVNPATEEVLAEVAAAGPARRRPGRRGRPRGPRRTVWGPMRPSERAKYLFRVARIIQERSRELAVLESLDNGKPIKESRDVDVPLAAAHFFYYAGWADKLDYAGFGPDPRPLGVAGQVIPWNFPLLMAAWKLAPALATGNTCVLKPAETTPLSALLLAEILQQADLPPGVVNILTGDGADAGRPSSRTRASTRSPSPARPRSARRSSRRSPAPASG